ncbi:MAG: DUF3244 domain-containing protein [Bacteroidales bacterium]|nr:DUF3244 domain-containing protein [Bacteroidales bacterium]
MYHITAVNELDVQAVGKHRNHVTLKGGLGPEAEIEPDTRSVVIYQSEEDLRVIFLKSLGNICVTVLNYYGFPVYRQAVISAPNKTLYIGTRDWNTAWYTIYITDTEDGCLEGVFEIE